MLSNPANQTTAAAPAAAAPSVPAAAAPSEWAAAAPEPAPAPEPALPAAPAVAEKAYTGRSSGNEVTVAMVKESGSWMGFSIYPDTKMDEERMVAILREYGTEKVLVNSAADWGKSDPLKTRKTGDAMLAAGFTEDDVDQVLWRNPVEFFAQSGRLLLPEDDAPVPDAASLFEGNSILRGQQVG